MGWILKKKIIYTHKEWALTRRQLIHCDICASERASRWRIAQMNWNGDLGSHKSPIIEAEALGAWVHVNISSAQKPGLMRPPRHASAEPDPLHHLHVSFCAAPVPLINLGGSNDALSALSGDSALWRTYIIYQSLELPLAPSRDVQKRKGGKKERVKKKNRKEGWRGSKAEMDRWRNYIGDGLHIYFSGNLFSYRCGMRRAADRGALSQDRPDEPRTHCACAHMEGKCLGR